MLPSRQNKVRTRCLAHVMRLSKRSRKVSSQTEGFEEAFCARACALTRVSLRASTQWLVNSFSLSFDNHAQ